MRPSKLWIAFCCLACLSVRALEPDQILLVTNRNVPQSLRLAQFYAKARHIPDHRILELDVPEGDDITPQVYDRQVVWPLRTFLRENKLDRKISCLVTFYGVPIRMSARVNTPEEVKELEALKAEEAALPARVEPLISALEQIIKDRDKDYTPAAGTTQEALLQRADAALRRLTQMSQQSAPADRQKLDEQITDMLAPIVGQMGMLQRRLNQQAQAAQQAGTPAAGPSPKDVEEFNHFNERLNQLQDRRWEASARAELREMIRKFTGPFEYWKVLSSQIIYFQTDDTGASFDNELALLWWEYPRTRWMGNPLHYDQPAARTMPVLMVSRLDAPTPEMVRRIITDSVEIEEAGLSGTVVLDSRAAQIRDSNGKIDPYGQYDQTIRNLANVLRAKSKLLVILDERPEVLPAHSCKNVAIYMGWYSVNEYIPACSFNRGAVGFHLASFTMTSIRHPGTGDWVRGLLTDGVDATLGPVAEPYLQSFPPADDFFELLLTGKLPLAEVYWKTTPMTSWMISLIGDPLYTPYKVNPALKPEDLPPRLHPIFMKPKITIPLEH